MRTTPLPEFQSEALLPDQEFAPIEQLIRAEAAEHGLELHTGHGRSVWCQVEAGEFGAKQRGNGVLVFARSHTAEALTAMQQAIHDHLAHHLPQVAAALRWPSARTAGQRPVNFSLAQLASVARLSQDFLRVRLTGAELQRFAGTESIHFRLVLPQPGNVAPDWPQTGANGQTVWPRGDKALHRPVYTVRAVNAVQGWLDLDIFDHAGGRAVDWARTAPPGASIGLLGPSGGGIPQAASLVLAGDETAYPAIARIVESRRDGDDTVVFLLGARDAYPMPRPPGLRLHHLPGGVPALAARLVQTPPAAHSYLWMATEKSGIEALRKLVFGPLGHDKALTHLSAYWQGKD